MIPMQIIILTVEFKHANFNVAKCIPTKPYLCMVNWKYKIVHGKKFGTDVDPSGRAVAFTGGELCDYTFRCAAFPLWVSSCPFFGKQLTYVKGTQRSFR